MKTKSVTVEPAAGSDRLITPRELSDIINVSIKSLATWRGKSKGPAFVKVGGRVMYWMSKVLEWLRKNECDSTAQALNKAQKLKAEMQKMLDQAERPDLAKKRKLKKRDQDSGTDPGPDPESPDK